MADGQRQSVSRALLVGRDPAVDARWPDASLVSVFDATKTVSKTHAVFNLDPNGLSVTDLHSSNGTIVEDESGNETDAQPDLPIHVSDGSSVVLGDFVVKVELA